MTRKSQFKIYWASDRAKPMFGKFNSYELNVPRHDSLRYSKTSELTLRLSL